MGNRETLGSPRHGIPRDRVKEEKARNHYLTRSERRPKQIWIDKFGNQCNLKNQLGLIPIHN